MNINKRRQEIEDFIQNHCNRMVKHINSVDHGGKHEVYFYGEDFCIIAEDRNNALTKRCYVNYYFLELANSKDPWYRGKYFFFGQLHKGRYVKSLYVRNIFTHYYKTNRTAICNTDYDMFSEMRKITLHKNLSERLVQKSEKKNVVKI
jgi:hypothetical protein